MIFENSLGFYTSHIAAVDAILANCDAPEVQEQLLRRLRQDSKRDGDLTGKPQTLGKAEVYEVCDIGK